MQSATIPNKPAELLKPIDKPSGSDKTSRPILTPRSPFPSGESTNKNKSEVTSPTTKVTAAIVESDKDGRRNFVSSALNTFHISITRHFKKCILK